MPLSLCSPRSPPLSADAVCRFWRFSASLLLWKPGGPNLFFFQREKSKTAGGVSEIGARPVQQLLVVGLLGSILRSSGACCPQTGSVPAALRSLRRVTAAVTVRVCSVINGCMDMARRVRHTCMFMVRLRVLLSTRMCLSDRVFA